MGFTMTRGLAVVALGVGVAALGAAPTVSAQDAGTIAVTGIDLENDTVEITNSGDTEIDINGLVLCNFPAYAPIEGADPIAPGASITVDAGAHGVALADDQGEFGLYTESSFEDPNAIISYVEWGTSGHQRSSVAVEAGIWDGGVVPAGTSLSASVDSPTSASDWTTTPAPTLAETGTGTWVMAAIAGALVAAGVGASALGSRGRRADVAGVTHA